MVRKKSAQLAPGVYWRGNVLWLELVDRRLPNGRLNRSLRTDDPVAANQRAAAVRFVLDRAEYAVLESWGRGEVHVAEVEAAVREMDFDRVRRLNAGALTLGEESDRLLKTVKATSAARTYEQYASTIRLMTRRWGADYALQDMTREEAEAWLHEPKRSTGDQPWAPKTMVHHVMVAKRLWREAIEREQAAAERTNARPRLTHNPWKSVQLPRVRQTRHEFLRPAEWRKVRATSEGYPTCALLALGTLAGLRAQEAAHLRTDIDLDLAARVIHIQPREGEHAWRPKTDNSIRNVPISEELRAILAAHAELGFAGEAFFIRSARYDRPITNTTVRAWTMEVFDAAGIEYGMKGDGLTYHSTRHTFASWLLLRRVPVHVVAKLMGDAVEEVLKTYAHLLKENLEEAVTVLDDVQREGRI